MFTQEDVDSLKKAIISGALEVEYSDKKVRYRNLDDMLKILELAENDLAKKGQSYKDNKIIKLVYDEKG
jgi:hypothetical protein